MGNKIYGNNLSFRTFDSSNVNQVELELPVNLTDKREPKEREFKSDYGFSKEIKELNINNYNYYKEIRVGSGESLNETIAYDSNETLVELTDIYAESGAKLNLVLRYDEKTKSDFRSSLIRLKLEKNSVVNLFIVQIEENKKVIESIITDIDESATLNLFQYEIGSVELYTNLKSNLIGEDSNININSIYFGYDKNELNLFYDIYHHAKKSNSDIMVNGALRDESYKNFKSTLDFKEGSSGAIGSEEEYATLLSDDVVALSVPVLLAHEDDVQGNHAASAGKIDTDLLFYLMSRGLDQQQAESLIVLSRFAKAIDSIEDYELRNLINDRVQEIVRR
ncbi:Iron-regulated ABC transporter permease protein SufD [Peptoniphilus asaccharolyticus DSM 20463]|uniref:Iron-regulated ABC transporter permease protein SufD n=1 Tax=Peptoniphilus asaccharolyticus DSM 20463 TaxID=573058 RepID=A0A1W1UP63_PEPAS|nr:SufD family Fe-S cluster assembly protein [Peptoniphilus asaccharolyticus]MBL7574983.1 SufD family Fe-S cluster assembly protein [Peptoniphilus asaccharolyticus]SMB82882.1 Iron-regulated ABC transporter permease protein SufD [Peptoniphilus asaccharolyticus DSM 20463]